MNNRLANNIAELNESVKLYLQARLDLVKLLLLKKATNSLTFLFGSLVIILLSAIIVAFAGAAFVVWYGASYNNYLEGVLLITGFFLLVLVLFIVFRKKFLTSIFLSNLSEIIFDDDEDEN